MLVRVETDKIRIIDTSAMQHRKLVHAVEISDERSHKHFVTAYTKKPYPDWEAIHAGHDPDLYHRDEMPHEWVLRQWPRTHKQTFTAWAEHYHLLFDAEPVIESFGVFISAMSDGLIREIREYFDAGIG